MNSPVLNTKEAPEKNEPESLDFRLSQSAVS